MQSDSILAETIAGIREILGPDLDHIIVERAVVGLFFTGVKLNTGAAGARDAAAFDPGGRLLPKLRDGDAVSRQASWQARR